MAGLDNEDAGGLALVASLLTLGMAPWAGKVLTTTTGLRLAFATTVRVVNGVHRHTADGWANALPACAAGLARSFIHVVAVTDLADRAEAAIIKAADFTGRHFHQRPAAIAVGEHSELASSTSDFAAVAWDQLDVVDRGAEWNCAEWHRVARFRGDVCTSNDGRADFEAERSEDVGLLAVLILDEGDAASAVRIVFDADDRCGCIVFATAEVDQAIVALVTTTDVAASDTAGVVTATTALQGREETLLGLALRYFLERRKVLVACGWSDWFEIFQGHDSRNGKCFELSSG